VLTWFEANWLGVVQIVAAVAQVVTAVLIVLLTRRLAAATDAYAKSAKDQVDELVQARLATIQPYLHLISAGTAGEPEPHQVLVGLEVQVELANLGSGPALDAIARLEHDRLEFITTTPLQTVTAGVQTVAVGDPCRLFFSVSTSTADPGGQALSKDLRLVIEYHDLAGRWWETRTPGTLGYVRAAQGTYLDPQIVWRVQEETVRPLSQPSLSGSVHAEDRNLHVDVW
jgi:hypothetical protein